jgi:hypothetical protein
LPPGKDPVLLTPRELGASLGTGPSRLAAGPYKVAMSATRTT